MRHPLRRAGMAVVVAAAVLVPASAPEAKTPKKKPDVTVMSRNLYLGADIITLVGAPSEAAQAQKASALWATAKKTNFPVRAKAIAAEVKKTRPDVIGLQEVARYYRGAKGVHDKKRDAKVVLQDWLALLQKQLRKKGLKYSVVSQQTEIDVETALAKEGYDLRLKLGNAVLVRSDKKRTVKVTKALKGTFNPKTQLKVPLADQSLTLKRGYAGMDGTVAGKKFRFLDPHAEAYGDALAKGQFQELLKGAGSVKSKPVIIAGDFNSDPADEEPNAYKAVIAAGFKDTAKRTKTCCQSETLRNVASELKTWIDHIVIRPTATVLKRWVVGNKTSDRISGLWPSDHAGVVVRLRLK